MTALNCGNCGARLEGGADGFYFGVVFEGFVAHFAAPAGLLVAAERKSGVEDVVAVDPDGAGAELVGDLVGFLDVARPDACGEAVDGVVGFFHDFVEIGEGSRDDDGAEDFLLHDFHIFGGVDEDRRLDEVALVTVAFAAGDCFRAVLFAGVEETYDAIELLFGHERAHVAFGIEAGTDADFLRGLRHAVDDPVENFLVDEEARAGAAALAVIEEDGAGGAGDGGVEIGVVENDVGGLAAEFERDFFEVAGAGLDDELADFGGAGEGDFVYVGVRGESGTGGFAETGDDIYYAFGEAGGFDEFAEADRGERSLFGRL